MSEQIKNTVGDDKNTDKNTETLREKCKPVSEFDVTAAALVTRAIHAVKQIKKLELEAAEAVEMARFSTSASRVSMSRIRMSTLVKVREWQSIRSSTLC